MPDRKKYLIVLGGEAEMELSGKDMLQVAIERFTAVCPDIRVITVLPAARISAWRSYCSVRNFHYPQALVPAGFTLFHSVRKALEKVPDGALVIIHDGDRPLVSHRLIEEMLRRMAGGVRALVPVIVSPDAVKRAGAEGGALEDIPSGEYPLFLAQTPQMYLSEDVRAAYAEAYDFSLSDPSSVVGRKQIPLTPVEGERLNFRVMTREELALAQAVIDGNS